MNEHSNVRTFVYALIYTIPLGTHKKAMLNKNTLGIKKCARPIRSSIANRYVRSKTLISVEAKKLLIKNLFNYLNDIQ